MAEELLILPCDKCGARLKVKPQMLKLARDAKCGKCGNRILLSKAVPASSFSPSATVMEPAPETVPPVAMPPPPPPIPTAPPAVSEDPAPAPAPDPAPVAPEVPMASPLDSLPKTTTSLPISRTPSHPAPAATHDTALPDQPALLKRRIRELEEELAVFRSQVVQLENQTARQAGESARFQELLQRAADAEDRAAELQQLWYQKEKEMREVEEKLRAVGKERDNMIAERDAVLNNVKDLMATYHAAEIEAARKRLADLDERMDRFVTLMRSRNTATAESAG